MVQHSIVSSQNQGVATDLPQCPFVLFYDLIVKATDNDLKREQLR
jgi:hypothetical protein